MSAGLFLIISAVVGVTGWLSLAGEWVPTGGQTYAWGVIAGLCIGEAWRGNFGRKDRKGSDWSFTGSGGPGQPSQVTYTYSPRNRQ